MVVLITMLCNLNAQYYTFNFGNFKYETDCFYNKGGFVTIKIKMNSLDLHSVEMMLGTKEQYNSFINRLKLYKSKMVEWDSICLKNNISKIDKVIKFDTKSKEKPTIWFDSYFNNSDMLAGYGWTGTKSILILHTGQISHLTNDYITCKGGVVIFDSPENIQEMIDLFNLDKVSKYIDEKNKVNNLLQ